AGPPRRDRWAVEAERLGGEAAAALRRGLATKSPARHTILTHREVQDSEPHLPLVVVGDPRRLRALLDDLLDNAVRYSPDGGAIDIALRPHTSWPFSQPLEDHTVQATALADKQRPEPALEIIVRDPGIGIPAAHLSRIFARFHRVDPPHTGQGEGMGLGLALCQRIVELHHGAIWAESILTVGSQFHVLLPLSSGDTVEVSA